MAMLVNSMKLLEHKPVEQDTGRCLPSKVREVELVRESRAPV